MPIFCIVRLKTADTNNGLLVSGGKSTIIPGVTINRFSSSENCKGAYANLRYTLMAQLSMVVLHLLIVNKTTLANDN
jgi:hypothetical protein